MKNISDSISFNISSTKTVRDVLPHHPDVFSRKQKRTVVHTYPEHYRIQYITCTIQVQPVACADFYE